MKRTHRQRKREKKLNRAFEKVKACTHTRANEGRCPDCGGIFEDDEDGGHWLPERVPR